MRPIHRFLFLLLIGAYLVRAQQPPETTTAAPAEKPPATEQLEVPDPPPDEPAEQPVRKPRRRLPRTEFARQHHSNTVFGESIVVKEGETIDELVLIGGTADIQGTVDGDVVIIGGTAKISGMVRGEFVIVGGSLLCSGELNRHAKAILSGVELTDSANLHRGVFFLGGPIKIAPGATIIGERMVIPLGNVLPKINGLKAWLVNGLLWGRLLPIGVHWAWMVAGFFVGLYFLTLILFPAAIKAIFLALEERPVTSVLSGFLTLILFAPLTAILVIAVVGIAVVPFLQVALVLSIIFGKAAVMCFLGRSFGRSAGAAFLQAPLIAFLVGATILILAYMIPVFGVLAWVLATVFGLGGAVVALSRTFKREEGTVPPARVLMGPAPAATATVGGGTAPLGISAVPPFSTPASIPPMPGDTVLLLRAGFWKRLLAALLDFVVLGLIVGILRVPGHVIGNFFLPVAVAYFTLMWAWRGTTLGSLLLRLKVVRTDGTAVTLPVALVRSLSSLLSALIFFLGFIWAGWDREKQSWHDKIAGTVVVQMPKGFSLF